MLTKICRHVFASSACKAISIKVAEVLDRGSQKRQILLYADMDTDTSHFKICYKTLYIPSSVVQAL